MHPASGSLHLFWEDCSRALHSSKTWKVVDAQTQTFHYHLEQNPSGWLGKMLRFSDYFRSPPWEAVLRSPEGKTLITLRKGWTIWGGRVEVLRNSEKMGTLRFKRGCFSSMTFYFSATDPSPRFTVAHDWKAWTHSIREKDIFLGKLHRKWGGLGKEALQARTSFYLDIQDVGQDSHQRLEEILAIAAFLVLNFQE